MLSACWASLPAQCRVLSDGTRSHTDICERSLRGYFVTMIAGIYQPQTRQLQVNAGHMPALVLGPGEAIRLIETGEQPLGILPDTRFSLSEPIELRGATLYLYSDGVTEAKTVNGGMLGQEGLVTLLQQHAGKPPAQRLQAVVGAIRPQQQLHDDITLLTVSGE
ncbi:MAG: PP2C family protein-serine/threonine phosphatase [Gammaproteobacteria bacterium]